MTFVLVSQTKYANPKQNLLTQLTLLIVHHLQSECRILAIYIKEEEEEETII